MLPGMCVQYRRSIQSASDRVVIVLRHHQVMSAEGVLNILGEHDKCTATRILVEK